MDEKMLFPKTWEEFEKHQGFYDSKQAYTFGNTRLIPSFRVEQWLEQKKIKERGSDGRWQNKCPECNEEMLHRGKLTTDDEIIDTYRCSKCGKFWDVIYDTTLRGIKERKMG